MRDLPMACQPQPQCAEWAQSWWFARHQKKCQEALVNAERITGVLLGDSLMQGWETTGRQALDEYFATTTLLNLGFNGDCTEHLLWRIQNGALQHLQPNWALLCIGTNNAGHRAEPPEDTAAGVAAVLNELQRQLPRTQIILNGILPRGKKPTNRLRQLTQHTNQLIWPLADGQQIQWLDVQAQLLDPKGILSAELADDYLHLSGQGYQLWAKALYALINPLDG